MKATFSDDARDLFIEIIPNTFIESQKHASCAPVKYVGARRSINDRVKLAHGGIERVCGGSARK